jgi:hypothetical protein
MWSNVLSFDTSLVFVFVASFLPIIYFQTFYYNLCCPQHVTSKDITTYKEH